MLVGYNLGIHAAIRTFQTEMMWFEFILQVSIFLKDKVQNSNGRFVLPTGGAVPYGAEVPGTIK